MDNSTPALVGHLLRATEPLTTRELGRLLGWPPSTVAARLRTLRKAGDVRQFGRGTGACYTIRRERAA